MLLSAPRGGEGRGEVGAPCSELRRVHLTLPIADAMGPSLSQGRRGKSFLAQENESGSGGC
jgi:hypothetical protein